MVLTDCKEIALIERASFTEPWSEQSFINEAKDENHIYLVAEKEGKIIGYCGMWDIVKEGHITNVCVEASHRHQGVGRRLLTELLSIAKEREITAVTLEVRDSNLAAISLYEQLGFHYAGRRKGFYSFPKEDAVIMWLTLT